ncbi:complement C1q-like protein 4 [Haliotis rufescens]|uniref:complement C1q-like protein 4 n=1 Tax=Haliotis rufescens TaxID=6454 RepID=UPI00201F6AF8|nr:complement C1q-like protein 4 [Haliotis rufescens]
MSVTTSALLFGMCLAQIATALWPVFPTNGENSRDTTTNPREPDSNFQTAGTTEVCSCLEEISHLEKQLRLTHGRLESFQHRMDELSAELYNMQNGMRALRNGLRPALGQSQDISFSARVGTNRPYLKDVDTVIFDDIIINNAGAYDPYTGKFTSPAIGVYHFSATILSGYNTTIETMFVVNGAEMGRLYSGSFNNRGSGTNSILVNLKQGDEVSINLFYGNGDYVHGQWSTFSGYAVSLFG